MKNRKTKLSIPALLLALLLLAGCGSAVVPEAETPAPEASVEAPAPELSAEPAAENVVRVSTVDELLAAIAPNTTIELAAGDYALYTASNYGKQGVSDYYAWVKEYDGPALEIHQADNLVITGEGADKVTLSSEPRYANVLRFVACRNLTIEGITAGHTREPGICSGGVLRFDSCSEVTVRRCGLFGCGTVGVWAADSRGLTVDDCAVYECSFNAVSLASCRDVRVTGGEVYGCGRREDMGGALSLFDLQNCDRVGVAGVRVHDNSANLLLESNYSRSVLFLSNEVTNNAFSGFFAFERFGAVVDGCLFDHNSSYAWYQYENGVYASDLAGRELDGSALAAMKLREIDLDVILPPAELSPDTDAEPGKEIRVENVDEFLAAIGPDRTIVLDGELFDLSAAAGYGTEDGPYYYWNDAYDGPELIIAGVRGLTIKAASGDPKATTVSAVPRYADVLRFRDCEDLTLIGFTAGHTQEPGSCAGGVLFFEYCRGVTIDSCRLYGCGVLGLYSVEGSLFRVLDTEIFECSQGGVLLSRTFGSEFTGCEIRDVPSPALSFSACGSVTWDGEALYDGAYDLDNGVPVEVVYDALG